jgi:hypothetical protein
MTKTCSGLLLSIFDVQANDQTIKCITNPGPFSVSNIYSGDIAIVFHPNNSMLLTGLFFISSNEQYLNFTKPIIYGFSFNYSISSSTLTVVVPKSYIDFGVNPFLKFYVNNGTIYVLEVFINLSLLI